MSNLVTPSELGCYRKGGFSPIEKSADVVEISEGVVNFPIGVAGPGAEMTARYYVHPKFKKISVSANGYIETLDPGYDFIRILVEGQEILYAASTKDIFPCGYEFKSENKEHDFTKGCKPCGREIFIESGLNDEVCNDGVQWTVTLVLSE